jgi:Protein of unknown function (DUF3738)
MLQNLLAERLDLVVHEEGTELAVYKMAIADGGLKMKETDPAAVQTGREEATGLGVSRIVAKAQSMTDVLNMMGNYSGRAVVDKTGLTGRYDYNLVFANDAAGAPEADSQRRSRFRSRLCSNSACGWSRPGLRSGSCMSIASTRFLTATKAGLWIPCLDPTPSHSSLRSTSTRLTSRNLLGCIRLTRREVGQGVDFGELQVTLVLSVKCTVAV